MFNAQTLTHASSDDVMNCHRPLQTLLSCSETPLPALLNGTLQSLFNLYLHPQPRALSLFVSSYNRMGG